jgi:hypothetical protein
MRLENYPHLWESEMYALIISTLEQGIEVKTYNNLGFCLTWAWFNCSACFGDRYNI